MVSHRSLFNLTPFILRLFWVALLVLCDWNGTLCADQGVPNYSHIVIAIEENHQLASVIGSSKAPYINSLARHGALFTNSYAITHPSQPNYFALYAGSTFGVTDDAMHSLRAHSLAAVMAKAHRSLAGYIDPGSPRKHNPWESFSDSASVERPLSAFPRNFRGLPRLSFVIPNLQHDMHDGSISEGDTWLKSKLRSYGRWASTHNSLLIVTFDEDDKDANNHIATIFYGAKVRQGLYSRRINHYTVLRTISAALGVTPIRKAAAESPIREVFK